MYINVDLNEVSKIAHNVAGLLLWGIVAVSAPAAKPN